MYTIFMAVAVPALVIAWIVYAIWEHKMRKEEENKPKQVSKRLHETRSEVADWAQKMAKFQSPKRKIQSQEGQDEPK
jgi:heme/copper-type cytochrome/quinol oxidase subunit 2